MQGVKRCQESTGRMKKRRYSNEFTATAVKMATAPDIETKVVAEALHIRPFMLSRWNKEVREGKLKGSATPTELSWTTCTGRSRESGLRLASCWPSSFRP
jgi:transposase